MENDEIAEADYQRFVYQVRKSGKVWALQIDEELAYCVSNEYEETDVLLFWSDRESALIHAEGEWSKHVPTAIPIDEFINAWLSGIDEDGAVVGLNWGKDLSGLEVEPGELVEELTSEDPA